MTIREKKDIPERTGAGNVGKSDQALPDTALEQLTGGATDMDAWPPCTTQDELDTEELAMIEGKSSIDAGTNKIRIEK